MSAEAGRKVAAPRRLSRRLLALLAVTMITPSTLFFLAGRSVLRDLGAASTAAGRSYEDLERTASGAFQNLDVLFALNVSGVANTLAGTLEYVVATRPELLAHPERLADEFRIMELLTSQRLGPTTAVAVIDHERGLVVAHLVCEHGSPLEKCMPLASRLIRESDYLQKVRDLPHRRMTAGSSAGMAYKRVTEHRYYEDPRRTDDPRVIVAVTSVAGTPWSLAFHSTVARVFNQVHGEFQGAVKKIGGDLGAVRRTAVTLQLQQERALVGISLLGGLFLLLAAFWISRRVIRPLAALKATADRIREGEFETRVSIHTGDEIEVLAHSMNFMLGHLTESYADLQGSRAELLELTVSLEARVGQRTAELSTAKERLELLDRQKSEFFSNISHELRTPLTLIQGLLGELAEQRRGALPPEATRSVLAALRSAQQLIVLISQLLDFSRLESGRYRVTLEPHNLGQACADMVEAFTLAAQGRGLVLSYAAPPDRLWARCDADAVRKIVNNLLSNALKFTPRGGAVEVKVESTAREAVISVSDTGIGIPADQLDHVFERFYQVDGTATREFPGSGIGLSLVRELVELQEGHITLESTVGAGSRFRVSLPLHEGPAPTVERPSKSPREGSGLLRLPEAPAPDVAVEDVPPPAGTGWVLVVDDNHEVADFVRTILTRSFHVRVRHAVPDALTLIADSPTLPDLLVSDVMMPKVSGLELCRRLKAAQATEKIPVMLVSARADQAHRLEALDAQADDYLVKPFDAKELLVRATNLVALREKDRALVERHRDLQATLGRLESTQHELVRAEKLATIGTLAAGVSHELNNAMQVIRGNLPLVADYAQAYEAALEGLLASATAAALPEGMADVRRDLAETVDAMEQASRRAATVVGGLREIARQAEGPRRPAEVGTFLGSAVQLVAAEQGDRICLCLEIEPALPPVQVQPVEIEHALVNILRNAARVTTDGGQVEITARLREAMVAITIRDHGPGIAPEDRARVFDPFFTTQPVGSGMGLGLAISESMVRRNGGQLQLESQLGKGAEFHILLPAGTADRRPDR